MSQHAHIVGATLLVATRSHSWYAQLVPQASRHCGKAAVHTAEISHTTQQRAAAADAALGAF